MKLHILLVIRLTRVTNQNAALFSRSSRLNREGDRNTWEEIRTFLPRFVALKHHRLTQLFVRRDLSARESCASSLLSGARSLNHCHRILFTWCGRVGLFPFAGGLHFSGSKAEKDTPSANTPATSRTPRLLDEDRRRWKPVTAHAPSSLPLSCRTRPESWVTRERWYMPCSTEIK